MKKSLCLAAMVMAALLVSCSNHSEEPTVDQFVSVSFSLDTESNLSTRAISDGTGVNQLMYAVFTDEGEVAIPKAVKNNVTDLLGSTGHTMTISLARGNTYQVVFWAQNSESTAYSVSDDMVVSVNYDGLNNDETRDAFFAASEPFVVDASTSVKVTLRRPFAQVNVGAFPFDFEQVQSQGIDISKSSATFSGIANQLNLLSGEATGEVDVNYSFNDMPTEDLKVDVDGNDVYETYEYLSMSYILAGKSSSVHSMSFAFTDDEGDNNITFDDGLGAITIQRNYRTNIVGQILNGTINFVVKIDPTYFGETINSAGLYYNFSNDTTIENQSFAFNTDESAIFTTENESLIKMNNVTFSGKVEQIAIGDYWKVNKVVIVPYRNELTNVVAKDMVVTHPTGIANVETIDYMAPLFFLRGVTTLKDCEFTGTTSIAPDKTDYNGNVHKVIAYDCGVPNECEATFDNCTVDALYAWSHSQITLKDTKVKYLRCSTHNQSDSSAHLTIDAGSVVDEIVVSSTGLGKFATIDGKKTLTADIWAPSLIIKAGAHVKVLDMNGRSRYNTGEITPDVIIEDGAIVDQIINEDTSYVPAP